MVAQGEGLLCALFFRLSCFCNPGQASVLLKERQDRKTTVLVNVGLVLNGHVQGQVVRFSSVGRSQFLVLDLRG